MTRKLIIHGWIYGSLTTPDNEVVATAKLPRPAIIDSRGGSYARPKQSSGGAS